MSEKHDCCGRVFPDGRVWDGLDCNKNAKVERVGKWYCGYHDPERVIGYPCAGCGQSRVCGVGGYCRLCSSSRRVAAAQYHALFVVAASPDPYKALTNTLAELKAKWKL